jgi:hypothetical protein
MMNTHGAEITERYCIHHTRIIARVLIGSGEILLKLQNISIRRNPASDVVRFTMPY